MYIYSDADSLRIEWQRSAFQLPCEGYPSNYSSGYLSDPFSSSEVRFRNPKSETSSLNHETRNPKPESRISKPETQNPKHETRITKPET